ncbi:MAG: hypothetical protein HY738_15135 [Bacteroidia bacterium]|nr:hypothetical protein [Bacteroidia bacterium]
MASETVTGKIIKIDNEKLTGTIEITPGQTIDVLDPGIQFKDIHMNDTVIALQVETPGGVKIGIDLQKPTL